MSGGAWALLASAGLGIVTMNVRTGLAVLMTIPTSFVESPKVLGVTALVRLTSLRTFPSSDVVHLTYLIVFSCIAASQVTALAKFF